MIPTVINTPSTTIASSAPSASSTVANTATDSAQQKNLAATAAKFAGVPSHKSQSPVAPAQASPAAPAPSPTTAQHKDALQARFTQFLKNAPHQDMRKALQTCTTLLAEAARLNLPALTAAIAKEQIALAEKYTASNPAPARSPALTSAAVAVSLADLQAHVKDACTGMEGLAHDAYTFLSNGNFLKHYDFVASLTNHLEQQAAVQSIDLSIVTLQFFTELGDALHNKGAALPAQLFSSLNAMSIDTPFLDGIITDIKLAVTPEKLHSAVALEQAAHRACCNASKLLAGGADTFPLANTATLRAYLAHAPVATEDPSIVRMLVAA